MNPNLTFNRILGIFPYRLRASTFELSKPLYILWTIIFCAVVFYEVAILYIFNFSDKIKLDMFTNISSNLTRIYVIFETIVWYILNGPRMRLLQNILDVSSKLPQQSYHKLSKIIHAKDIFGFFLILFFILNIQIKDFLAFNSIFEVIRMYPPIVTFQMDMLYINCVCVLKACFKEINDNLENLQELVINNISEWISYNQRQPLWIIKLKGLKKQHMVISNTMQMLNLVFSLQLLATLAMCAKQIIFYVYSEAIRWQNGLSFNWDILFDFNFPLFIVFYGIRITFIIWACESGKNQAMEISTTIHDMINNTNDKQMKSELKLFSLQITHCKNAFSAKGLIVDAKLFTEMINNIITYLLILIQFLIISHSCDGKKNVTKYTQLY
ncbi:hypothetical protein PUN28_000203 [Cardiocondyla obscurior]